MKQQGLEAFSILKRAHGESEAKLIVEYIESKDTMEQLKEINSKLGYLATKQELSNVRVELKEEISNVRLELKEEIGHVRLELKEEINNVRVELKDTKTDLEERINKVRVELSHTRADIIKWMFIFWVGQVLATCAFILLSAKR